MRELARKFNLPLDQAWSTMMVEVFGGLKRSKKEGDARSLPAHEKQRRRNTATKGSWSYLEISTHQSRGIFLCSPDLFFYREDLKRDAYRWFGSL